MAQSIQHALVLHLYQPPHNLQHLLQTDEQELQRILMCYERIPRFAHKYVETARLHVIFSIPLLQQLLEPSFSKACAHLLDIPAMLEAYRLAPNIEFIASSYQHAPLPLVPRLDWEEQLQRERDLLEQQFGRAPRIYWPAAGAFSEELIPCLVKSGYEAVLLPHTLLSRDNGEAVDPYRSYTIEYQGSQLSAIPMDEGFSRAQEFGLQTGWFADEVRNGVAHSPVNPDPYLVTSCSDAENGEWFRRLDEENGFFGHFFAPYMEFCETGEYPLRPVMLSQYLRKAHKTPAVFNPALPLEAASEGARHKLQKLTEQYWQRLKEAGAAPLGSKVRELLLQAEGSCYLLAQGKFMEQMDDLLEQADRLLHPPAPRATVKKKAAITKKTVVKKKATDARKTEQEVAVKKKAASNKKAIVKKPTEELITTGSGSEQAPPAKKKVAVRKKTASSAKKSKTDGPKG